MSGLERVLEYVTLAAIVLVAVTITFCAEDAVSIRTRLWSVRWRWTWAAEDSATTSTVLGRTVTVSSTRATAMQLLHDAIGEL